MNAAGGWPAGIVARPVALTDLEALADLSAAVEKADDNGEHLDLDDLRQILGDPKLDLAADTLGVWAGEELVGFQQANTSFPDRVRIWGAIHPAWRRRGLGRRLLAWGCARAEAVSTERGGEIHVGGNLTNASLAALLTSAGFEPTRYFFRMERDLSQPVPDVAPPEGVRVLPFAPEWSEATRLAHNEAFGDHWGSRPRDEQAWRTWVTGSRAFRPSASWLAVDGDEVAAFVLGYEFAAETAATGVRDLHVGQVGTRRAYRGRGIARALLARMLAAGVRAGYGSASLGVDADNPTGALGLYERLGFAVRRKYVTYVKEMS